MGAQATARGIPATISTMTPNLRFAPILRTEASDDRRFLEARFQVARGRVVRFEEGRAAIEIQQYEFRTQSSNPGPRLMMN